MTKQKKIKFLIIYVIAFYALWAFNELLVFVKLNLIIENEIAFAFIESGIIKNLVWTLPAIFLISYFKSDVYINLKEMFSAKVTWIKYLPLFIIFTACIVVSAIFQTGKLEIASSFGIDELIVVLFVGLTEEMVFRGWLLNATINEDKKWKYILINAIMFLAIHFPIWISNGIFISSFTSLGFLQIIILSIIFSCTFIKSESILVPIALHMYWDLLIFLLIG